MCAVKHLQLHAVIVFINTFIAPFRLYWIRCAPFFITPDIVDAYWKESDFLTSQILFMSVETGTSEESLNSCRLTSKSCSLTCFLSRSEYGRTSQSPFSGCCILCSGVALAEFSWTPQCIQALGWSRASVNPSANRKGCCFQIKEIRLALF